MEALHVKSSSGLSLYNCISEYISIREDEISEQLPAIEQITADFIAQCRKQVEPIKIILDIVGQPCQHALYGLEPVDNRQETLETIYAILKDFKDQKNKYDTLLEKLNSTLYIDLKTGNDLQWLKMFADSLSAEREKDELYERVLSSYDEGILKIDVEAYAREWEEVNDKWFLPRYFAKKRFLKSLQVYGQIFETGVESMLKLVGDYQDIKKRQKNQEKELFSYAHANGFSHQDRYEAYIKYLGNQKAGRRQEFLYQADALTSVCQKLTGFSDKLNELTINPINIDYIISHLDNWLDGYNKIKDWYHWVDKKRELQQMGVLPVISLIENGTDPQEAMSRYLKGIYHILIETTIDTNEQLRMFNGLKFRQKIEKYKRDTATFQELSKEELYSKLASRVPATSIAIADGSEISILKRNIANGGRGSSIRSIIDSIPTLLPRLCPCMLMSPISVAQYIDMNAEKFDLVIFDEASQMPTSEAVGSIS